MKTVKTKSTYSVYVTGLKYTVLIDKKFRKANPEYHQAKPCYYVGSTAKTPKVRAEEHRTAARNKRGKLYCPLAMRYFDGLRPSKYKNYRPMKTMKRAEAK